MAKSVAALAAEQGVDEKDLVHALILLARRRTIPYRYDAGRFTPARATFTVTEVANLFGLSPQAVRKAIEPPPEWSRVAIVDALFAFHKKYKRWPGRKEWRRANGLPSPWKVERVVNPSHYRWGRRITDVGGWVRPWDRIQRWLAADSRCTPRMALEFTNVLARREAIDRIGFDNMVKAGVGVSVRDNDPEFGTLYSLPGETPSERMVLIKVVNSTAEPDGTFADYYLRVPPHISTVQEALAWSFNLPEAEAYRPLVET